MTGVISNKAIILVVLTTMVDIAVTVDEEDVRAKCKKQVEECSIKDECFKDSRKNDFNLKAMCDIINVDCGGRNPTQISLYAYEKCSFSVPFFDRSYYPKNRTYSVFIGDTYDGANMQLVPGCCNLKEHSECLMPPTRNKTKKFFAVFPQNEIVDEEYCYRSLDYHDIPIEKCEKGKKIEDPCWDFTAEGGVIIKYKFQLLDGREDNKKYDAYFFTFPSHMLPQLQSINFEDITTVNKSLINVTCAGDESDTMVGTRRISKCKMYREVTSIKSGIVNKIHEPANGDLICFDIVKFDGRHRHEAVVHCKRVKVSGSKLVWKIGVPIAAFIVLILIVSGTRLRRVLQKISKEKKDPSAFTLTPDNSDDSCVEARKSSSHQTEEMFEKNLDEFYDDMKQLETQTEKGQESESSHLLHSSSTERISCDKLEQISLKDGDVLSTEKSTDDVSVVECGYIFKGRLIGKSTDTTNERIRDKLQDTKLNIDGSACSVDNRVVQI